ncbi:MAG: CBS domain-containing protein [Thaumarchaeota archaeon]|nr:CBS domain-containing protein [Nitrososphaerota archaeon]MDE1842452.1 CBS domain-containing protein [Nitrososphaerota archaeon]
MTELVHNIMKKQVVTVDSSMSVKDAAKIMEDTGVGCVIVMEQNVAIGILTERDFVRRIVAHAKPLSTFVKDVMSSPLIVINPDESVWELAEIMKLRRIHKVPVVHDNRLVGIVTTTDLTKLCSAGSDSEMRRVADQILLRMKKS